MKVVITNMLVRELKISPEVVIRSCSELTRAERKRSRKLSRKNLIRTVKKI
jgi:hypothetical protein